MFNVTVLKMKDIKKYLVGIIVTILIVVLTTRYFSNSKKENYKINNFTKESISSSEIKNELIIKTNEIIEKKRRKIIGSTIPIVTKEESQEIVSKQKKEKNNYLQDILKSEISAMKDIDTNMLNDSKEINDSKEKFSENTTNINKEENNELLEDNSNIQTQIVTQNPIQENYNVQYKNVKIKNQTDYTLSEEMLTPDISIENKNVLLFHTHTCESYTSSEQYQYDSNGNFRTTDLNYTVARVGTELTNYLNNNNYNVLHDTTYHDYPSYTGSYTRSLQTVENILQKTPSDIIFDIHRDAVGSRSDYAPTVRINDDYAAQIMFVIGTNDGGLWHPNWNQNLKFAIKIQEKAEEKYPGLFKPIMLTKSRYNQHAGKFASIIEVGATGNTLEQCLTSMKYLADIINEVVN